MFNRNYTNRLFGRTRGRSKKKFNLENYHDQIVKGVFPVKYLDFNFLKQKKEKLITIYKKSHGKDFCEYCFV